MPQPTPQSVSTRWNPRSIAIIVVAWLALHIGGLFTPGLLDDVDSIYIEIAREMLHRHDFITPMVDGVRFFDKPPLMYWLASASMRVFGEYDWAARLPLALLTLALLLATYALGLRLFRSVSPPEHPDRGAFYSALALATCIGPYLYTRFYIPDIVIALWMTIAVHLFLITLDRIQRHSQNAVILSATNDPATLNPATAARTDHPQASSSNSLLPALAFAAVLALNVLTKGLIGLVFPLGFVFFYLALTRQLRLLAKFHLIPSTLVFLSIAAPWHILAALRNPAIALPPGLGLPARGGWAWFYLYNEHIARFLSRRIPHDYGQVPVLLFWLLAALWLFPWLAFLPGAFLQHIRTLSIYGLPWKAATAAPQKTNLPPQNNVASLTLLLWPGLILIFFTFSARQEYYSLPAIPALALLAGGLLAQADLDNPGPSARSALLWHRWLLVPLGTLTAAIALYFAITAPKAAANADIATLLAQGGDYNLSLSHIFDLTAAAMGLFREPLTLFGLSMLTIGPVTYFLRSRGRTYAANLALAAAAAGLLLAMHSGLVRFYPTLGSKSLAEAILADQVQQPRPSDLILIDGELTAGSTLPFYTRQPVHLVDGRINGPWYGSFWPDSPAIFETDATLHQLWASPRRIFLLTYHPEQRTIDLRHFGQVNTLASAGGKSVLTNQP